MLLDVTPPTIAYTPLAYTSSTAARTITATITDVSSVATGANQPVLYWAINAGAYTGPVAPTSVVGNQYTYTLGAGVVLGDVVKYFFVAQDQVSPPNVGSAPAGATVTASPPLASAPPAPPSSYSIVGCISGTKTVGAAGDYATITAAVADLNAKELCGPFVLSLLDAAYPTETFPIVINANPGSSSTNTVRIKPASGVTVSISGASASGPIFKILNNYTTIDGSNALNGTTRDLSITNTSVTTPQILTINSTGTTPVVGVTVKNCVLVNGVNSSSGLIISDATGIAGYFNNITIQNNSVQKAYIAIYALANVVAGNGSGLLITGNDLSTSGANSIRLVGVYVQGVDGATVSNNSISFTNAVDASNINGIWFATGTVNSTISGNTIGPIGSTTGAPKGIAVSSGMTNSNVTISGNIVTGITTSYSSAPYGIYVYSTTTKVLVEKNKVSGILNSNTSGYGARGIHVLTGVASSDITIKNNFVSDVKATSDATNTYWVIGIGIEGTTSGVNVYSNSVNLSGTYAGYASATISAAFAILTATTAVDIRDNIFVNTYENTAGVADKSYAIYSTAANTAFTDINYNDYYAAGAKGVLGYLGADQTTLAAWQTSTGKDANSISGDPLFLSTTDLHLNTALSSPAKNTGIKITSVPTDIDGETRNDPPDMGADDYSFVPTVLTTAASAITSTSATLNGNITASNESVAVTFQYGTTLAFGTTVAATPATVTGNTATAVSYSLTGLVPNTTYYYQVVGTVGVFVYIGLPPLSFTTPAILPTVTTNAATSVTSTGAVMNGTVNANNASTVVTFEYGLTTAYGTTVTAVPSPVTGLTNTAVSYTLSALVPNTTYHFRVNGANIAGTANGLDLTFTTPAILPVVVTDPATVVTGVSATLNGTVNANNASTVVTFEYGTTVAYGTSVTATPSPVTGVTNTAVTYALSGLTPNTTYHFRAVGVNSAGTANGADRTFTTTALAPTVVTTAATPIGSTTATLNGTVNANNQSSAVTFEYGLTTAYGTTLAATPATVTGYSVTSVSAAISGLALATSYHYRAIAVNATGTTNGNDMTFTTGCVTPAAAGTITGLAAVCQSTNGVAYSVGAITNATSYVWTLPAGATIATGSGTNSITVDFSGSAASGNISVYGSSGCASGTSSSKAITLNARPVPVITGAASACVGSTGNSYSTTAAMTGYTWTVSAGGTITAGAGTNAVSVTWNTAGAQTVSVNYTNASSCNATTPTVKSVTVNALPVPTITGLASACVGTTGVTYTTEAAMIGYAWTVSAGGTITAGAGTNAITVTWNTAGAQNVYVNYINGNGCTATTPVAKSVTVNALPVPTITGLASACIGATGVIYTTEAAMTGYTWTVSAGGTITAGAGTNAITVTWSTVGAKTVSVNYTNANTCTAASATVKNVTVNPLPVPTITGPSFACNGSTGVTYTTETGMTGYAWTVSAGGTITAGAGTSAITVTWNTTGAKTVTVNYVNTNGCTALTPATYSVTVGAGTTPTITGTASLCAGATGVIYTTQPGFNNYVWSISYGGIITAGLNSNQVSVNWATAGSRYISVNYENTSGCSAITPYTFNVTVLSVPVPIITGNANLCQGTTGVVYTTDAYYTGYTWTISAGGTITAGAGTNAITVSWNTGGSQSVSVNYTNALGCTAIAPTVYNVTVNPKPATAGTITGTTPVCAGTQGVVYTVAAVANATSYTWTVPTGVTIVSGGSTNAITVNFAPTATTGIFKVLGVNDCGNGTSSPNYSVVVNPIPVTPVITSIPVGGTAIDTLVSSAPTGNQWYLNGVAITGATGKKLKVVTFGSYTVKVTLTGCSSLPSNTIVVTTIVALSDLEVSQSFEVYPNPNHGQFNIKVVSGKLVELNIEIYNNLGALLWKQENVHIDGTFTTPVTLNEAPAGVYMVALRNKDMNIVRKVVILK